jgi:(E)-4-hydroxy-3-methylbut-2-enyl-diphosphate synthase
MEFLRICEDENYYNVVLSMKASNPQVMVEAYRLLVNKMVEAEMNYPLHLGVTEAGDGEDGRIKSSLGIGTLLEEGIGDTIRVSLTEEPEFEIPVCKTIVNRYGFFKEDFMEYKKISLVSDCSKKETTALENIGGKNVPVVIFTADDAIRESHEALRSYGYYYSETLDKWNIGDMAADYIYLGSKDTDYKLPGTLRKIYDYWGWRKSDEIEESYPLLNLREYNELVEMHFTKFLKIDIDDVTDEVLEMISSDKKLVVVLSAKNGLSYLAAMDVLKKLGNIPVVFKKTYNFVTVDEMLVYPATDIGGLFLNGYGNGIWLESNTVSDKSLNSVSFGILQASRMRISKTEYISCPSCGRTLFDLQETTARVREKTGHLKGLKIAIMGCIVNGPGEMADADYGYVGSGIGKITLYKGKEVVKRSISSDTAVDELIELIKSNGDWVDV